MDNWSTWRMDTEARLKEIIAREQEEKETAETIAKSLLCTIHSAKKFGDRLEVGYLITCSPANKEFWIWGAHRPMSSAEVETYFRQQIENRIIAEC